MTPSGKLPAAAPEIKGADAPLVCEMISQAAHAGMFWSLSRELPDREDLVISAREHSFRAELYAGRVAR